jgi:hypothetical protein
LQRPGAVKGTPFLGVAERTLEGEDRCDRIAEGGKDLSYKVVETRRTEDNHDKVE